MSHQEWTKFALWTGTVLFGLSGSALAGHDRFDELRDAYHLQRRDIKDWYQRRWDRLDDAYRRARAELRHRQREAEYLPRPVREDARRRMHYERKRLERELNLRRAATRTEYRRLLDEAKYEYETRRRALKISPSYGHAYRSSLAPEYFRERPAPTYYKQRHLRDQPAVWERALTAVLLGY